MKLAITISRSLQADMQAELRDIERAVASGTRDAGRGLKTELRRQVTSAGLGQRLANSWRDRHYPNQRLDAASLVYTTKAPQTVRAFDEGAVVRSKRGRFLAIPTENAPRKGIDGKRISPTTFPEHRFGPLRFVPRSSGPSLLVVDGLRASYSRQTGQLRGFRRATTGHARPGCFAYFLPGLSDNDSLTLWRALRVKGSRDELGLIFRSIEGHPLLIQALAREVASYRRAPGNFDRWRIDHPQFDPTTLPLVQSRTQILHYALTSLDADVLKVLRALVAFRMPAPYDTLEGLLVGADKACADPQGLDRVLTELEDRGLIGWDREANRYDAHPIVRGVVWQQMSSNDQQAVYTALAGC
jgi:Family of unknown function (DUF6441)